MILCDIGNSTYHFLKGQKDFKVDLNSDLRNLRLNDKIYFISVNEKATIKLLKAFPDAINLNNRFKIKTKYSSTLGIDRIVASNSIKNSVVVDFG
ncbi:MAG: pantothenate kinase, partial [Arcobacteraceae bacterium]|nr:pantothenate kinase [Arcobacteraceae bacterium]